MTDTTLSRGGGSKVSHFVIDGAIVIAVIVVCVIFARTNARLERHERDRKAAEKVDLEGR